MNGEEYKDEKDSINKVNPYPANVKNMVSS